MITGQDLIRLALGASQSRAAGLDVADQALMITAVQMDAIERLTPVQRGQVLSRALMSPYPMGFFRVLRACAGLKRLLPELDALFGIPMLADGPGLLDAGEHQLRLLEEVVRCGAPLPIRLAALLHKIGMGGTPRLLWPFHVDHEARGLALLAALAQRIALPPDTLDLAALVIREADYVHRANDLRAGRLAQLLDRVQAQERPARFEQLLTVCACDFAAYTGYNAADYSKVLRLRRALAAYLSVERAGRNATQWLDACVLAIERELCARTGAAGPS